MRRVLHVCASICTLAVLCGAGWALEGDDCLAPIIVPELPYNKMIANTGEFSAFMDLGAGSCTGAPTAASDVFFEITIPGQGLCLALEVLMPCGGVEDFCMYILDACDPSHCVAGVDSCGSGCNEYMNVVLEGGMTYYFVIDGKTEADTGCAWVFLSECQTGIEEQASMDPLCPALDVSPNPTKFGSNISYGLRQPTYVNLDVLSISGQFVKSLYSGNADEGIHTVAWAGNNEWGSRLPSGTYFVVLSTNGQRVMKRVQLLD